MNAEDKKATETLCKRYKNIFHLDNVYGKGRNNLNANALSRIEINDALENELTIVNTGNADKEFEEFLRITSLTDQHRQKMKKKHYST